jgi:hypothetical protein
MSTNTCIVYFGLRFEVAADEVDGLEGRTDARIVAARNGGVKHYWGNFSDNAPRYLLFVGSEIGIIGPENATEATCTTEELHSLISTTKARLVGAGFKGESLLHVQWQPDH